MSQSTSDHVAAQLRAEMARQQITAAKLAADLDVSEMWISRRARGITEFTISELMRVADVLGVPVTDFLPVSDRAA